MPDHFPPQGLHLLFPLPGIRFPLIVTPAGLFLSFRSRTRCHLTKESVVHSIHVSLPPLGPTRHFPPPPCPASFSPWLLTHPALTLFVSVPFLVIKLPPAECLQPRHPISHVFSSAWNDAEPTGGLNNEANPGLDFTLLLDCLINVTVHFLCQLG